MPCPEAPKGQWRLTGGATPPAISLTPLRGVPSLPPSAVLRTGFRKGGTSFSDSLSVSISVSHTLPDALTVVWHNAML